MAPDAESVVAPVVLIMENTLNIQITLNDEQLKNLIVGNINELPKEKLQDILLQAIKDILMSEYGRKLFISTDGYYNSTVRPSNYLEQLVEKADVKDAITPVVNEAVSNFATNYPVILETCVRESISKMFMHEFQRTQLDAVWSAMMNMQSGG